MTILGIPVHELWEIALNNPFILFQLIFGSLLMGGAAVSALVLWLK